VFSLVFVEAGKDTRILKPRMALELLIAAVDPTYLARLVSGGLSLGNHVLTANG
jgi:hypothetical protein